MALDVIPNNIAMANVCCVPQSYIYLRVGAKDLVLITKVCDSNGVRVPLARPFNVHDYVKIYSSLKEDKKKNREKMKQIIIEEQTKEKELLWFERLLYGRYFRSDRRTTPQELVMKVLVDPTPAYLLEILWVLWIIKMLFIRTRH